MKKKISIIIITILMVMMAYSAQAAISLGSSSEWPFIYPTLFLKGGVNAVISGDSLVFWAVGDTVSVIDKAGFTELSTIRISTSTTIQDMLFDDDTDTLYIAAGYDTKEDSGGLQMVDVSDPENPVVSVIFDQSVDNPGSYYDDDYNGVDNPDIDARGLGLDNGKLFLADDNYGLRIIDVGTDPANPAEVALADPPDEYISGYKQPNISGSYDATGGYVNLSVYPFDGKVYAFVLDFYNGIKVFDVTDPTVIDDPVVKGTLTYVWLGSVSLLSDLFVTETNGKLTAYVTGTDEYSTKTVISRINADFDESTPPVLTSLTNFGRYLSEEYEARSTCVSGNYSYLACGSSGLKIVDISDEPVDEEEDGETEDEEEEETVLEYELSGSYTTGTGFSYSVHVDGTDLYLATAESGLIRLDITDNPASPEYPSSLTAPVIVEAVRIQDDVTYILDKQKGLRIFDTEEPSYPLLRSFVERTQPSTDFWVLDDYAYIMDDTGTLTVLDISDPEEPVVTSSTLTLTNSGKLFVSGTTLYVAGGAGGVHRVDISTPLSLSSLSSIVTAGSALSVYVDGSTAYVAEGNTGLEIFDLTDSSSPVLLATAAMDDARDVALLDQETSVYALIADGSSGLKILDVTDLSGTLPDPVTVNTIEDTSTAFTALSVAAEDSMGFVGMGADGVLVLDLADPESPVELVYKDSDDYAGDIVTNYVDDTLYLAVSERGAGMQLYYIYDSDDDDTEDLVPTIDAGCFIESSGNKKAGWEPRALVRTLGLFLRNIMTGDSL